MKMFRQGIAPMDADLLLHICCGPCAIRPGFLLLGEGRRILGYFYNPNIHPLSEYLQRREGAVLCAARLGIPVIFDDAWDIGAWLRMQLDSAARCRQCISQRLGASAEKARALGIGAYSTSLLYSRYQPHDFIRAEGERIGRQVGVEFVYRDFRPEWQAGIETSKEWGLYRQKYCGCIFSESERYAKKLRALQKG